MIFSEGDEELDTKLDSSITLITKYALVIDGLGYYAPILSDNRNIFKFHTYFQLHSDYFR